MYGERVSYLEILLIFSSMKETLKKKVTKILELYPRARNDDIALQCFLIRDYFPQGIKQDEEGKWWISTEACRLYRDDHISRVRAIIQNQE